MKKNLKIYVISAIVLFGIFYYWNATEQRKLHEYEQERNSELRSIQIASKHQLDILTRTYHGDPIAANINSLEEQYKIVCDAKQLQDMSDIAGDLAQAYLQDRNQEMYQHYKRLQNKHRNDLMNE